MSTVLIFAKQQAVIGPGKARIRGMDGFEERVFARKETHRYIFAAENQVWETGGMGSVETAHHLAFHQVRPPRGDGPELVEPVAE